MPASAGPIRSWETTGRPDGVVIDADDFADEHAERLGLRRRFEPVVEATDLVRFKMAPGHVAKLAWIHQRRHRVPQEGIHSLQAGVQQLRLFITNQKVLELQIKLRDMDG